MAIGPIEAGYVPHNQPSSQSQRILNRESRGIDRVAPIRAQQLNIEIYTSFTTEYRCFILAFRTVNRVRDRRFAGKWIELQFQRQSRSMPPESRASHTIANPGMIHGHPARRSRPSLPCSLPAKRPTSAGMASSLGLPRSGGC